MRLPRRRGRSGCVPFNRCCHASPLGPTVRQAPRRFDPRRFAINERNVRTVGPRATVGPVEPGSHGPSTAGPVGCVEKALCDIQLTGRFRRPPRHGPAPRGFLSLGEGPMGRLSGNNERSHGVSLARLLPVKPSARRDGSMLATQQFARHVGDAGGRRRGIFHLFDKRASSSCPPGRGFPTLPVWCKETNVTLDVTDDPTSASWTAPLAR